MESAKSNNQAISQVHFPYESDDCINEDKPQLHSSSLCLEDNEYTTDPISDDDVSELIDELSNVTLFGDQYNNMHQINEYQYSQDEPRNPKRKKNEEVNGCIECNESYSNKEITEQEINELFSLDETMGYSDEQLFEESINHMDIFCGIRHYMNSEQITYRAHKESLLPKKKENVSPYTLVLDLDGTLVHCDFSETGECNEDYDSCFDLPESDTETGEYKTCKVCVRFRPYLFRFLAAMKDLYEIIVFTAGTELYGSGIVNLLNKNGVVVSHSLYRKSCHFIDNSNHLKEFYRLNRDMKKTVIIDDTPLVYANSIDNAIPILSWEDDPSDKELFILIPFLQELAKADDVTELIRNRYHLQDLLLNRSIN